MAINVQLYANNAETTLSAPISSSDLTINVVDGSPFPTPGVGQYFLVTIEVGTAREIIKIIGRSGNTLTVDPSGRGEELTTATGWPAGALVEMRITKETLAAFSRYIDVMFELNSINDLVSPFNSAGNSYITHSTDDGGSPIVAIRNNDNTWKFLSHHKPVVGSGTVTAGTNTTTQITSTNIADLITSISAGKYIIQFTNGTLAGQSRIITTGATNTVSWSGALTITPTASVTTFEIYQSDASLLSIGVLLLSGGTMAGPLILAGDATTSLNPITKQQWDTQNTSVTSSLALKAPLASPTFTGTPTAPTVSPSTDGSTKIATTQFVQDVATNVTIKNTTGTPLRVTTISSSNPTGGSDGDIWFKV